MIYKRPIMALHENIEFEKKTICQFYFSGLQLPLICWRRPSTYGMIQPLPLLDGKGNKFLSFI